jgi:hypothetical protein
MRDPNIPAENAGRDEAVTEWRYSIVVEGAIDRVFRPRARNPYQDADDPLHRLWQIGRDEAENYVAVSIIPRLRAA